MLTREVKTRRESVEAFRGAGREASPRRKRPRSRSCAAYLPEPLDEAELDALVSEAVDETGATSPRDLGKVMGGLLPRTRGRADGKVLSGLVMAALARADLSGHDQVGH